MNSEYITGWLICVFILLLFFVIFSKPFKAFGNFCINAVIGLSTLFSANFLLSSFGLSVGINLYTAVIAGILGLPGTILLYALKLLINNI